jgi:protein-disulfide isomerase
MKKTVESPAPLDVDDHINGPEHAQVTVVSYCDFECPYCGRGYPVLKQLQKRLADRLRIVFRHFPLEDKHPFARQTAEASEAAAAQGQFWGMHDLLFENQDALDEDSVKDYAASLGLDMPRFEREVGGRAHAKRVDRDIASGRRSGVTGTPTYFVNGRLHTDQDTLERLVLRLMKD